MSVFPNWCERAYQTWRVLLGAPLLCLLGVSDTSASIIQLDISGRAESVRVVCDPLGGCGPGQNISSQFALHLSFDSGPAHQFINFSSGQYEFLGYTSGTFFVDQVGTFPIATGNTLVTWREGMPGQNAITVSTPSLSQKVFITQPGATGRYQFVGCAAGDDPFSVCRGSLSPEVATLTGAPGIVSAVPGPTVGGGLLGILLACTGLILGLRWLQVANGFAGVRSP
ncbi:MAG TPA: hypothetical protein VNK51_27240 [Bradyrhizobium sp.]|nr:hypothetical protein [Bradyrhizobium sp.]